MDNSLEDWRRYRDSVADACHNRWSEFTSLFNLNVSEKFFEKRRNETCPTCGRKDKLFIADQATFAAHCAAKSCDAHFYNGIALFAALTNERQATITNTLAKAVGVTYDSGNTFKRKPVRPKSRVVNKPKVVKNTDEFSLSNDAKYLDKVKLPLADTPAERYLKNRGLDVDHGNNQTMFFVENARYVEYDDNDEMTTSDHPALISKVIAPNGKHIGFHKVYLTNDGKKADVKMPKKLSPGEEGQYTNAVIELTKPVDKIIGIAEGVETALALNQLGIPCQSVISANGILNYIVPDDVEQLWLFGDLDISCTGQRVIIEKMYQLRTERPNLKVRLFLPPENLMQSSDTKGIDFLDVLQRKPEVLSQLKHRLFA